MAKLAAVSAPTVYAHFPTLDELYLNIFRWLQPRLGLEPGGHPETIDGLAELPASRFPAYARYGSALRALLLAPGFHRARASDRPGRHGAWSDAVGTDLPELEPEERRLAAYALNAFWTPTVWNWLTSTAGLTTEESVRVAEWATRSLIEALRRNPRAFRAPDSSKKGNSAKMAKRSIDRTGEEDK